MDVNAETVEPATSPVNVQPTTMNATRAEPKAIGRNAVGKHVEQNTNVKQVAAALADVNAAPRETVAAETYNQRSRGGQKGKEFNSVETNYETDGELYQKDFYSVTLSSKSLDSIQQDTINRDEAYTKLRIRPPWIHAKNYITAED